MKWKKLHRLDIPRAYAAMPIADHIRGDIFRIYFTNRDSQNRSFIEYIEIDIGNPDKILSPSKSPVITAGSPGYFDDAGAMTSWITNYKGEKWLYYIGWNLSSSVPFRNSLGLAISRNKGITFEKFSTGPIMDRSMYDPAFVGSNCVMIESGIWRMWYLSCIGWRKTRETMRHYYHIKYAESNDGMHWRRNGIVCIDFASSNEYAIARPCVIKENGVYKMWYCYRGQYYRIGYAESADGIKWKRKGRDGGLDISKNGWDSEMVAYPYVFNHKGTRYMLYNGNEYGKTGFGLAVYE